MSGPPKTLILNGADIAALMTPADYRTAVKRAFLAGGDSAPPMQILRAEGGFHVKGAVFEPGALTDGGRGFAAFKVNGNFPGNPGRNGLPTIQGAIVLCDSDDGSVLAILDSAEVTLRRTAAATAVAAEALAHADAETITVCGCGVQGRAQLEALAEVLPLTRGFAWDLDGARAVKLARHAEGLGLHLQPMADLMAAANASDVIVTCTSSHRPFLGLAHAPAGTFVAAVGADHPDKSELEPGLMAAAAVVTDVTAQCLTMGDLHHAVAAGAMTVEAVRAELAEVLSGRKAGRRDDDEIVVFDSTGTAIQDVASAAVIYERAIQAGAGLAVQLGGR